MPDLRHKCPCLPDSACYGRFILVVRDEFRDRSLGWGGFEGAQRGGQGSLVDDGQPVGGPGDRDVEIVADPAGIVAQSENGAHDLYVAITRATHRLTVIHEGDLPPSLHSLAR